MARRNLELTETLRGKEKKGSLLWVLDKTKTAMGGRLLRSWLERPLLDPVAISRRLEAVGWLVDNAVEREELVQVLREITDLERLISRIVYGTAGARDLVALAAGLDRLPLLQDHLPQQAPSLLARLRAQLDGLPELTGLIAANARMRPGGLSDLEPSSVKKKFKDKKFAAKIDRSVIQKGCDLLGLDLTQVIALCIEGMREEMAALGLGPKA